MKKGFKKRGALLLSALFTLTLIFGAAVNTRAATNAYQDTYNSGVTAPIPKRTNTARIYYYKVKNNDFNFETEDDQGEDIDISNLDWNAFKEKVLNDAPKGDQYLRGIKATGYHIYDENKVHKTFDSLKSSDYKGNDSVYVDVVPSFEGKAIVSTRFVYPAANRQFYNSEYKALDLLDKSSGLTSLVTSNYRPTGMDPSLQVTWEDRQNEYADYYVLRENSAATISHYARTSNFLVAYDVEDPTDPDNEQKDTIKSKVVSAGTQITLPSTIDGKPVKWSSRREMNGTDNNENESYQVQQGETYTVNTNMIFYAVWDNGKPIAKDDKDQNVTVEDMNDITDEMLSSYRKENGTAYQIPVDMGVATIVPTKIFEAAKGRDIDLVLSMGGYSWTINGKDINDADNGVNLEVVAKDSVPDSAVKELAGNQKTKELSLTYDGAFGFKATLTYNISKADAGKYGNLFWYKKDGTFQYISSNKIDNNGDVALTFTHASDYVIVMSDQPMSQRDAAVANDKIITTKTLANVKNNASAKNDVNAKAANTKTGAARSPKTGQF